MICERCGGSGEVLTLKHPDNPASAAYENECCSACSGVGQLRGVRMMATTPGRAALAMQMAVAALEKAGFGKPQRAKQK